MYMDYNIFSVEKWHTKAITKVEQIKVGMKVFGDEFEGIVSDLKTDYEYDVMRYGGCVATAKSYYHHIDKEPRWFAVNGGDYRSLNDMNVGKSYNPWLMFDNAKDRDEYYTDLKEHLTFE